MWKTLWVSIIWSKYMLPEQTTPASSPWPQLFSPNSLWSHLRMDGSWPLHLISSSQIWSFPSPKKADFLASRTVPHFTSRHTTSALVRLHWSSHTVPQLLAWWTSTLPEQRVPPASRTLSHPRNEEMKWQHVPSKMKNWSFFQFGYLMIWNLNHLPVSCARISTPSG